MKTLKSFFSVFLLVIFVGNIAQAQNVNPRHVPDLNLTDTQIEQLQEIEKEYIQKKRDAIDWKKMREEDKKDMSNFYKRIKAVDDAENVAQKAILTPEQLTQYEGYVLEHEEERKGNKLSRQIKQMNDEYPGMEFTEAQNIALYEKLETFRKIGWDSKEGVTTYQDARLAIYREVLDDRQFALYEKIEEGKAEIREAKILVEYKKAIKISEEILPIVQDFTMPKFKVLRNKLEAKISPEDKEELVQLRAERLQSFEVILDQMVNEDFSTKKFKNPELIRNIELTKEMVVDNSNIISNLWSADFENFFSNEKTRAQELAEKYAKEINAMEKELLWTVKESVKKSAVVVAEEYPIPPVAIILSQITEFPDEAKALFLLLDPEVDFALEMPEFGKGEGDHFASAFPNPAVKNQTLEFFIQQDAHVTVEVLDESGRVVKTLASENMYKGNQKLNVDISDFNSQLYFYRITTGDEVTMLKFTVVK